jgi:hypothetical protein
MAEIFVRRKVSLTRGENRSQSKYANHGRQDAS